MNHYLLLGAGFSRNWGGWLANEAFEYLLGDRAILRNAQLRDLLWKNQPRGGFEAALDELRQIAQREPAQQVLLAEFESAIVRMFDAMNAGYNSQPFEFRHSLTEPRPLQSFLSRFTAIFTLNQDLLLERHYLANKNNNLDFESWKTWQVPGMKLLPAEQEKPIYPEAIGLWQPTGSRVLESGQPVFKLHGSSNWRTSDGKEMLILGGGKKGAIAGYPVLNWYFEEFANRLNEPDTRLMVVGYSFRDVHVNEVLHTGISRGLRIFVIDPNGSDVAKVLNPTAQPGYIYEKKPLEQDIQLGLVGASRRSLREIFGSDEIERAKVMRFLDE